MSRATFQHIIKTSGKEELEKRLNYLNTVDQLKFLSTRNLHKIVDLLEEEVFDDGDAIIHQGAHGDTFYIISEGTVEVSIIDEAGEKTVLREMGKGNYFGEMALLSDASDKRTATVKCTTRVSCYTLDREPFRKLIGNVAEKVRVMHENFVHHYC